VEHHNVICQQIFTPVLNRIGVGGADEWARLLAVFLNGGAWLLLVLGIGQGVRLVHATLRLEREILPYLRAPSSRLAVALERSRDRFPRLPAERFYECALPMSCSSLLGGRRIRCVLSSDLVSGATEEELEAVIAHEAIHLLRRDLHLTFGAGLLNGLFFFLRPLRLLTQRWREEAELACDRAAVAATRNPLSMASAILRASGVDSPANPSLRLTRPAVTMGFTDEAACPPARRVKALLNHAQSLSVPSPDSRFSAWGGWAVTAVLVGSLLLPLVTVSGACFAHCSLEAIARFLH
jgi:Zn-dependent protease with chaperone function